jgi:hypothetical protein
MASYTADNRYAYDEKVQSSNGKIKTLLEHSNLMNYYIEYKNGWTNYRQWPPATALGTGRWGTDINVCRIAHALEKTNSESTIEQIAEAVHNGWVECFNYWYVNKPWIGNNKYHHPGKDLTSREKESRANLSYNELDEYQKRICRQMASYIKRNCM